LKPPDPATDNINVVDWPDVTLADGGAAEIAKLGEVPVTPLPDSGTCCGEPPALSVITICPEREPVCPGVNTTEIEQLAPAATLPAQLLVCEKSAALAPETAMLLIDNALLPVLSSVTASVGLPVPMAWSPKFNEVVAKVTAGVEIAMAVPLSCTICGLPAALSFI